MPRLFAGASNILKNTRLINVILTLCILFIDFSLLKTKLIKERIFFINGASCKTPELFATLVYIQQRIIDYFSQLSLFALKDGILRQTYPVSPSLEIFINQIVCFVSLLYEFQQLIGC